jgi:hypothetical protein
VLEILTVCCYYSDTAASMVAGGMRLVVQQDIEVKSAVMQVQYKHVHR